MVLGKKLRPIQINYKKRVDFILNKAYIGFLSYAAPSSNGKRADLESVNLGSNPRGASILTRKFIMTDIIAVDKLRLFIERIERIEADLDARKADRKEVYSELKGDGFDTKATRQIVRLRKKDAHIRQEEDMILETYRTAIGL